jgi:hypothetical protein
MLSQKDGSLRRLVDEGGQEVSRFKDPHENGVSKHGLFQDTLRLLALWCGEMLSMRYGGLALRFEETSF